MSLAYPLGLLGLIGIPILILIYIIKNKYTEKTISSTYLWTLSERFLKRRVPISKIVGIVSLILQILVIILISFTLAQPVFEIPRAAKEYCFILDGSGSMNIVQNGSTRFDRGKDRIEDIINSAVKGSSYTLIYVGENTELVYENYTDKERALKLLSDLDVSNCASVMTDALGEAQEYFNLNPSVATYLITDKSYKRTENLTLINISEGGENFAVSGPEYALVDGRLTVSGTVTSYQSAAEVTVELYLDGSSSPFDTQQVVTEPLVPTPFTFECRGLTECKSARIVIPQTDILPLDNEAVIYNVDYENSTRTLLVSDDPFYIRAALISTGNSQIDTVSQEDYQKTGGYDLYIFDSFTPDSLPEDGAVWFFNPRSSLPGTNFNYQGDMYPSNSATYSKSTSKSVNKLLGGLSRREFELAKYVKCGFSGKFTTLVTCDENPLVFAGTNVYGNREVVFAFDLHDTAPFTLSMDCSILVSNLIVYSFPAIIDDTVYFCGDTLQINVTPDCESILVKTPAGREHYPDTDVAISEFKLSEVGSYTVTVTMNDKTTRTFNVFAALPEAERIPVVTEESMLIQGRAENNMKSGYYDDLIIFFIILAVIAVADYGVYCYEQYQLR